MITIGVNKDVTEGRTYGRELTIQIILSLSLVVLNSRDRQGNVWLSQKRTWINISVIVSAD